MKKISAVLFCILIMIATFAPLCYAEDVTDASAAEEKIEYMNINYNLEVGTSINDTEIFIYASKTSDPTNLVDMTDQFEVTEVFWCKVITEPVEGLEEDSYYEYEEGASEYYLYCTDEDFVDETSTYLLVIRDLQPADGTAFNFIGLDRILINGTTFDQIGGEAQSDGSNLFLSFKTTSAGPVVKEVVTETIPETVSETVSETEPVVEETSQKCSLCGICPFQPQGVCLFIWIGVIVAGIVVILILVKSLIKKDDEY